MFVLYKTKTGPGGLWIESGHLHDTKFSYFPKENRKIHTMSEISVLK